MIRHYDVTGKICPKWFTEHPDAWEQFKQDVAARLHPAEPEKKSGWYQENGGWRFYLGDTGEPVRNAWYKDGDDWYWFDGAGIMVHDTWKTDSKGLWYYLGTSGAMEKNTWVVWKGELYRLNEDGSMFLGSLNLKTDDKGAFHPA